MSEPRVLIVDDEESVHDIIGYRLADFSLVHAYSGRQAVELLDDVSVDVAIVDLNLPGINGFELLDRIRERAPDVAILVLTGHQESRLAFEAGRRGARFFLEKSYATYDRIVEHVREASEVALPSTPVLLDRGPAWPERAVRLIEKSGAASTLELVGLVRASPRSPLALVLSERGCDRASWAHLLHCAAGRASGAPVFFDASRSPPGRLREQLSGDGGVCEQLIRAGGGTLFVDHADGLSRVGQLELALAATEANGALTVVLGADELPGEMVGPLDAVMDAGALVLRLSPLRERRAEIASWIELYTAKHAAQCRKEPPIYTEEALRLLCAADWPGNEAELEQVLARMVLRFPGVEVSLAALPPECFLRPVDAKPGDSLYRRARREFERYVVRAMLERHDGDRAAAAAALGISHSTLKAKLRKSG